MTRFDFGKDPHRRYDPLHDRWVLVSPQRTQRPWQGQQETRTAARRPTHDPSCYLCPGNERANGARNPDYQRTFVFTNDFAALRPETGEPPEAEHPLLRQEAVEGSCRVICFSPRHDLTLAEMTRQEIRRVVDVWNDQLHDLAPHYRWVQLFENKGAAMGCSNPHPHGQLWASSTVPTEVAVEDRCQREGKSSASWYAMTTGWWSFPSGPSGPTRRSCCHAGRFVSSRI
jgi:UDPglucose--hexose-1-phosphate uridylyltransferase